MKKNMSIINTVPIQNLSIIKEEEDGYASELVPKYRTIITDSELRSEIAHMSALEIIT